MARGFRGMFRPIAVTGIGGLALALSVVTAPVANALPANCTQPVTDGPVTCTYVFTGAEQTFEVPANVTQLRVDAVGGQGGNNYSENFGGRGFPARVVGDVTVTPESTVYVLVAGAGQELFAGSDEARALGGFNGGGASGPGVGGCCSRGGGGGASDVRTVSSSLAGSLESRVLVAAGGGGEGSDPGGAAGEDGLQFQAGALPAVTESSGKAGTATAGGAGGRQGQDSSSGMPGVLGQGGDAGATLLGGGGGGGLYGGGGGASYKENADGLRSAGGGGGSSLVPAGGSFELAAVDTPATVVITYQVGSTPPPAANCFGSVCLPA